LYYFIILVVLDFWRRGR